MLTVYTPLFTYVILQPITFSAKHSQGVRLKKCIIHAYYASPLYDYLKNITLATFLQFFLHPMRLCWTTKGHLLFFFSSSAWDLLSKATNESFTARKSPGPATVVKRPLPSSSVLEDSTAPVTFRFTGVFVLSPRPGSSVSSRRGGRQPQFGAAAAAARRAAVHMATTTVACVVWTTTVIYAAAATAARKNSPHLLDSGCSSDSSHEPGSCGWLVSDEAINDEDEETETEQLSVSCLRLFVILCRDLKSQ